MNQVAEVDVEAFGLKQANGKKPEPVDAAQVATCRRWLLEHAEMQKRINPDRGSYGLKHAVERWTEVTTGQREYVTNGAFIVAALRLGYSAKPDSPTSPNVTFNLRELPVGWPWAMHSPFAEWLVKQKGRNDSVGALAQDAVEDKTWPHGIADLERLHGYLYGCNACNGAHEALDAAWRRFAATFELLEKPNRRYPYSFILDGQPRQMRAARLDAACKAANLSSLTAHSIERERARGGKGPGKDEVHEARVTAVVRVFSRWWPMEIARELAKAHFSDRGEEEP